MKKATGTKTIRTERLVLKKIMPWRLAQAQWLTLPQMAEFNMAKAPYTKKFTRDFICRKFVKYRKKRTLREIPRVLKILDFTRF